MRYDCFSKSSENYQRSLDLYMKVYNFHPLDDLGSYGWYDRYESLLIVLLHPEVYGYSNDLRCNDNVLIENVLSQLLTAKWNAIDMGIVALTWVYETIKKPYDLGIVKSFELCEISVAMNMIESTLSKSEYQGNIGKDFAYFLNGWIHHNCKPKTQENLDLAKKFYYQCANMKSTHYSGSLLAYFYLNELLTYPIEYGFKTASSQTIETSNSEASIVQKQQMEFMTSLGLKAIAVEMERNINFSIFNENWGKSKPTIANYERAIELGSFGLSLSDSLNIDRMHVLVLLGWIYNHKLPKNAENYQLAAEHYKKALTCDPAVDMSMETEYLGSPLYLEADQIKRIAVTQMTSICRELTRNSIKLLLTPKTQGYVTIIEESHSMFEEYVASSKNTYLIGLLRKGLEVFKETHRSDLASTNPTLVARQKDIFEMAINKDLGSSVTALTSFKQYVKAAEKLNAIEENEELQYLNEFYSGFSIISSQCYMTSTAVDSGILCISTDNLAETIASNLLSLTPIIGNVLNEGLNILWDTTQTIQLTNNARNVVKFARSGLDLDVIMQNAVVEIMERNVESLLRISTGSKNIPTKWYSKVSNIINNLQVRVVGDRYADSWW